jgi:hypothetical protein
MVLALALTGCMSAKQIGPYVKSVARDGAWLAVTRCTIVVEGDNLSEGPCTLEHVPIGAMTAAPVAPALRPGTPLPAPQPIPR